MSEFDNKRDELKDSRSKHEKASTELYASRQRIKMLEKELTTLQRTKGDNNPVYQQKLKDLQDKLKVEREDNVIKKSTFESATTDLNQRLQAFQVLRDPRDQLQQNFPNSTPFLLFPLRIETRFKAVDSKKTIVDTCIS